MTVIAMTREIGSRGTEVAAGVAAELGLEIVNSEIVASNVAGNLGVEYSTVQRYLDGSATLFERWQIDKRKLSRYTSEQILSLALKGDVLIRGWGAAALFREIDPVMSVRVCAPMALRERVMMDRLGIKDVETIRQEIQRFDAAHARAMRASFEIDSEDARLYHIVLNSARLPVEACIKAITQLAREPQFQDDTAIRSALTDKLIETRVRAALAEQFDMTTITLSANDGRIILEGTTSSGSLAARAEKLARDIEGVREVDNRIVSVSSRMLKQLE